MKLIAAISAYNAGDFILETLYSLMQIKDLNAVHICDGPWAGTPIANDSVYSNDGTWPEVSSFRTNNMPLPFELIYHKPEPSLLPFRTQSEKRNYQLQWIAEFNKAHGNDDYYVLVIDADEVIQFPNGLRSIWLKETLNYYHRSDVGLVTTYAYDSDKPLIGGRFLPGKVGVHYHTERAMVIHDKDCNVLVDYNPGNAYYNGSATWQFYKFFLVNNYIRRSEEALERKRAYYEYKKVIESTAAVCKYQHAKERTIS